MSGAAKLSGVARAEGRYRRVRARWWTEPATRSLTPTQKLVALYLLSGPQTNSLGVYRLSPGEGAEDLAMELCEFRDHLSAVCELNLWAFDAIDRVIWIPSWLAENAPQSPNVAKSWRSQLDEVPDCAIKATAMNAVRKFLSQRGAAFLKAFGEVLPEVLEQEPPKASCIQEQDQDQEQIQEQLQEGERPRKPSAAAIPRAADEPAALMDAWNTLTHPPLPRCRELTTQRRKHAKARLSERPLMEWRTVIKRIQDSAFCRGESGRGQWVADFDFLLKPGTAVKVLEGKYDDRRGAIGPDLTDQAWAEVEAKLVARRVS